MRIIVKIFFLSLLLLNFSIAQKNSEKIYQPTYSDHSFAQKKTYIFGIHPVLNAKGLFRVYQPLVDFLNEHLMDVQIKLESSRSYAAYDKKLFSGYFDLALPNPYETVIAADLDYEVFGKMGDNDNFRGIILVRKDSKITSIDDLRGKNISYPAPTALAATMLPQYYLYLNGINIHKDIKNSYVGTQESSIMNVYLKKSIASSTWIPSWKTFVKLKPEIAKELKVQWTTESLPNNGLIAKKDFPKDLLKQISKIFFELHTHERGRKLLEAMELSKYEKADYKTYNSVRRFLKFFNQNVREIEL